jgi:hypothetical protein
MRYIGVNRGHAESPIGGLSLSWTWNEETDVEDIEIDNVDDIADPVDDEETGDEGGSPNPEIQAAIREAVEKAVAERERSVAEGLREYGLDIGREGKPVIHDPSRLAQVVAPLAAQHSTAGAGAPVDPKGATDDDEMPNPYEQPAEYQKWMLARIERAVASSTSLIAEQAQRSGRWVVEREAVIATQSVKQLLPEPLKYLGEHPEFDDQFQKMLLNVDPEQWRDPRNLVKIASMLVTDLPAPAPPTKTRDASGKFSSRAATADLHRQSLDTHQPARDGSRAPTRTEPTTYEVEMARQLKCSVAELRALDPDDEGVCHGDRYLATKRKRLAASAKS